MFEDLACSKDQRDTGTTETTETSLTSLVSRLSLNRLQDARPEREASTKGTQSEAVPLLCGRQ